MKTTIKRLSVLLLAICMICALAAPLNVQAAVSKSTKKKLNNLVDCMYGFEFDLLVFMDIELDEVREVTIDKSLMAQAAALNCESTFVSEVGEWGTESIYSVTPKQIKKMAKKMFGKTVTYKSLPKGSADDAIGFNAAYLNADGNPELWYWEGETETDYVIVKTTYKKTDKGYDVIRDVFCGYWGINAYYNGKKANYRVTYNTAKKKGSTYGYVIAGMTVEYIADLVMPDDEGEG